MTIGGGDLGDLDARGMVADTASAALVAADGTADWWCPGRFDAAPVLTRLLDPPGACLRVGPTALGRPVPGRQSYRDGTFVLETLLPGRESLVSVEDVLPWDGGRPPGRLVRRLHVLRGPVDVSVDVVPGGDARDVAVWSEGVACPGWVVRCGLPFSLGTAPPPSPARAIRRLVASASTRLDTGQSLVVTADPGAGGHPLSVDAAIRVSDRTATAWRRIRDQARVGGDWADAAARSLLVLTALAGGGAPVEAPTTSLPRLVGGERNTDGRVVWLVTAAGWAQAAAAAGMSEGAEAAAAWMAAVFDGAPPLPAALAVDGSGPATELHVPSMAGWRRSQPVLAGTNAPDRVSLEPAAAMLAAAAALSSSPEGGALLSRWDAVAAHADWLVDHAEDDDASVWDLQGPRQRWVAPRLAVRHALAEAATSARRRHPLDLDAARWALAARRTADWLATAAVGPGAALQARPEPGGPSGTTDAGLVRVAWWGPWPPTDAVTTATVERVIERNGDGPWVRPWPADGEDGLPGAEPASVTATLWLARALARCGRTDEAQERLEAAVALAGPLHLLSESVDAATGLPLGNRPSAAAHLALVEAARALDTDERA